MIRGGGWGEGVRFFLKTFLSSGFGAQKNFARIYDTKNIPAQTVVDMFYCPSEAEKKNLLQKCSN